MPLIGFEAWNAQRREAVKLAAEPHANGIACPQCSAELTDSNPGYETRRGDNDLVTPVTCQNCKFQGWRVV